VKIDYFIIGTQKSGTTSLHRLLSLAPEIQTHRSLEFTFFSIDSELDKGERYLKRYYFPQKNINEKKKLAKHSTACYRLHEIKHAFESNPQMQFFLVFRNPVYRAFSSYLMEYSRNLYPKPFKEAIQIGINKPGSFEHRVFLHYGVYDKMLEKLYCEIPKEQIHIVLFEEFMGAPIETANQLLNKLHLEQIKYTQKNIHNSFKIPRNYFIGLFYKKMKYSKIKKPIKLMLNGNIWNSIVRSMYKLSFKKTENYPQLSEDTKKILFDYYKDSILNFEKITGIQTNWLKNK
jgi:hypothetical protein